LKKKRKKKERNKQSLPIQRNMNQQEKLCRITFKLQTDLIELTILDYISNYCACQAVSGHYFYPAPPQMFIDECREQPELPK